MINRGGVGKTKIASTFKDACNVLTFCKLQHTRHLPSAPKELKTR